MNQIDQISRLINHLTSDEDLRQDLWLHYLSGNSPSSFVSYLHKINKEYTVDTELQSLIWRVFKYPPSDKFYNLLKKLSEVEQSVVCLLALGLTVDQISKHKGISEVRIRQVIYVIRYNESWKELYGIEETTDRRRTIRA